MYSSVLAQLCLTLCNPMDCSPPGTSVHGFPRQEYWSGLSFPPLGDLPDPRIKLASPALAGGLFTTELPGSHTPSKNQKCLKVTFNVSKIVQFIG